MTSHQHKSDFPRVRASILCPLCSDLKAPGAVTCWPCHNICEFGTLQQREGREALLAVAEAML